jgi:hypothetical protein
VLDYEIGIGVNFREEGAIKKGIEFIENKREKMNKNFENLSDTSYFGDQDYIKFEDFLKK